MREEVDDLIYAKLLQETVMYITNTSFGLPLLDVWNFPVRQDDEANDDADTALSGEI
jgi:hypothetical protein